jgi:hypothetical protein
MKRYPYPIRLILMAGILSPAAIIVFPKGPLHVILECFAITLFGSGVVLLYLRKTGRVTWNGPNWGAKLQASPAGRRVLRAIPALCAAWIPILLLFNRRWGLSDAELAGACGVLLGISFAVLVKIKSRGGVCCEPFPEAHTQQGGTK